MKTCSSCKESKDLSSFSKHYGKNNSRPKDGLQSWCIPCMRLAKSKYKKANPDKNAANQRASYASKGNR